ncbi:sigma-70 family RNA polymerase sigma factor [Frigoriglobus tundricola]|uniref:ECF RNA polymerase sigma factor SigE n=1 Tax=Frigoriglobus tundricola TaxID=2774151 RepID=A0A6M5YHW0_9BACT|nr:sigma-70 family RNA polymerase sigma factor [Frigoriglobus tundricola]QJW92921.1 hypothetical protein FTUN_0418 [Frigoriglobus tundricola]
MPTSSTRLVIERLREALHPDAGADEPDERLLSRFASGRDAQAFALLVRRHGPMVMGVCRRTARNPEDAEDAFQATFLVLVRKADAISAPALLANWLHGVAYNTARKARAVTILRGLREKSVAEIPDPAGADREPRTELSAILDEELNRLPEMHRAPLVLCYLEGKTQREAARNLGCPEKTLASRLARAREVLAKRLARRGFAVTGVSLGGVLAQTGAAAGVPNAHVRSAAARLFAAAPGTVPGRVAALTEGVLKAMSLSKLRYGVIAAVLAILVAVGAGAAAGRLGAGAPPTGTTAEPPTGPRGRPAADDKKKPAEIKGLDGEWLLVGSEDNGKKKSFPDGTGVTVFIGEDEFITLTEQMTLFSDLRSQFSTTYKFKSAKAVGNKPAWIDLLPQEAGADPWKRGIYKLDGDVLTICWGKTDRPREFAAPAESGNRVHMFKRVKSDD